MQCWCHAAYGQFRLAARPGGLCGLCSLAPGRCERVHAEIQARMLERAMRDLAGLS